MSFSSLQGGANFPIDRAGGGATISYAFGGAGTRAGGASSFFLPYYSLSAGQASLAAAGASTAIFTCRLSRFFIRHGNPGAGGDIVYTLLVGGVATPITITLNSAAALGFDVVNTLDVVEGSSLSLFATHGVGVGTSVRPLWEMLATRIG